jgi:anthranilate synthase component 2
LILLVDNYDSFTHNLWQLLRARLEPDADVTVVRNDAMTPDEAAGLRPDRVVLSPGPGDPSEAGLSLTLPELLPDTPVLGVCLGHQALALAAGASIRHATAPTHGQAVSIHHGGLGLFTGQPDPIDVALYHSLAVDRDDLPPTLHVDAWTDDGTIMALHHTERPHHGVQFHPESFMTAAGTAMVDAFLAMDSRIPT